MIARPTCLLCGSSRTTRRCSVESIEVVECWECGLQFLDPLPAESTVQDLYDEQYFQGKLSGVKGYRDYRALRGVLIEEARRRLRIIASHTLARKLLDVGAGTGIFLEVARERGYAVAGNDVARFGHERAGLSGVQWYYGRVQDGILPDQEFEIICAWDVIEHIADVNGAIRALQRALKPGGYLFLTTPDTRSVDARLVRGKWYGYQKAPEHVVFFNRRSLVVLLERNGLELVEFIPWGFVRTVGFLAEKLQIYSRLFAGLSTVLDRTGLGRISVFFPFTDCLVVARKPA